MTTAQMRAALSSLYGQKWRQKVSTMTDAQVFAIYTKFKRENKI